MQVNLFEAIIFSGIVIIVAAIIAEVQYMQLKSATSALKRKKDATINPVLLQEEEVQNLSFKIYSLSGIIWILLYVVLWTVIGQILGNMLTALTGVYIPIYIILVLLSFYRSSIAVGVANNARTDLRYKSFYTEGAVIDE